MENIRADCIALLKFLALWFGLIILVYSTAPAILLAVESMPDIKQWQRSPQSDTWAELCGITDCDQYPPQHTTIETAAGRFFLPIPQRAAGSSYKLDVDASKAYVELRKPFMWSKHREVLYEPYEITSKAVAKPSTRRITLSQCCNQLFKKYGIPLIYDQNIHKIRGQLSIYVVQRSNVTNLKIGRRRPLVFPSRDRFFDRIARRAALSFNVDYWDVTVRQKDKGRRAPHLLYLISKTPLAFGQHVAVICQVDCRVETVFVNGAPKIGDIALFVTEISHPNYNYHWRNKDWERCKVEHTDKSCIDMKLDMNGITQLVLRIEQLFHRLQSHPLKHGT